MNPRKLTENLTEQQIELLRQERGLDRETFLETAREFTMYLAEIASEIINKQNSLARAGNSNFNDVHRTMAMMILIAHGFTAWEFVDNGWEKSKVVYHVTYDINEGAGKTNTSVYSKRCNAKNFSKYQLEFIGKVRNFYGTDDFQYNFNEDPGFLLSICEEIVCWENKMLLDSNPDFNNERRTAAMTILGAYGGTKWVFEEGCWIPIHIKEMYA